MNRKLLTGILNFIILFGLSTPAVGTEHEFFSNELKEQRHVSVTLPENYDDQQGVFFPVLYVLDGRQQLPHTAGTAKTLHTYGEMPSLIIVSVDSTNRMRDLTPVMFPGVQNSGKADAFLTFLTKELRPFINRSYRTNNYNMLAGHSLGGLFAAYSLMVEPEAFQARFAFSPSLRFLGEDLFQELRTTLSKKLANNLYFYMNVGSEQQRVLDAFHTVKMILNDSSDNLTWKADELPEETHFTTPIIGQFKAFRDLFSNWKLSLELAEQGIPAIESFYQAHANRLGFDILPEEAQVNSVAYEVLNVTGNLNLANALFELNLRHYPKSPNALIGLSRVARNKGEFFRAVELMEKALALVSKQDNRYPMLKNRLANLKNLTQSND